MQQLLPYPLKSQTDLLLAALNFDSRNIDITLRKGKWNPRTLRRIEGTMAAFLPAQREDAEQAHLPQVLP
jgi:hypothetical protein